MPDPAFGGTGGGEFSGILFYRSPKIRHGLPRRVFADKNGGADLVDNHDRLEIIRANIGQTPPVHHVQLGGDHGERIAIRLRLGPRAMTGHTCAAGPVDHIDARVEHLVESLGGDAADGVGSPTRRPRAYDLDSAARELVNGTLSAAPATAGQQRNQGTCHKRHTKRQIPIVVSLKHDRSSSIETSSHPPILVCHPHNTVI